MSFEQAHPLKSLLHRHHVAEELLLGADAFPHGHTALHAVFKFNLDGRDLAVGIELLKFLGDEENWGDELAVASFHFLRFQAFGDLLRDVSVE